MKHVSLALCAALTLAACSADMLPETAPEVRTAARNGHPLLQVNTMTVARSPYQVNRALAAGSAQCLDDRRSTRTYVRGSAYGPQSTSWTNNHMATFRTSGARGELVIENHLDGALLLNGGSDNTAVQYVVDTVPVAGGTQVTTYGARIGYGDLTKAVREWAEGGPIRCPRL